MKKLLILTTLLIATNFALAQDEPEGLDLFVKGEVPTAEKFNSNYEYLETEINQLKEAIEALEARKKIEIPVGTIMASMLNPIDLEKNYGVSWVLADGRDVTTSSRYYRISGFKKVPDLRGMFLRGLNEGRDDEYSDPDGDSRRVGYYQSDQFESHTHLFDDNVRKADHGFGGGSYSRPWEDYNSTGDFLKIKHAGGSETRPNNISVYFYIKIN